VKFIEDAEINTLSQREDALVVAGGIIVLQRILKALKDNTLENELRALVRDLMP
jgi:hypothetical protein